MSQEKSAYYFKEAKVTIWFHINTCIHINKIHKSCTLKIAMVLNIHRLELFEDFFKNLI